jgi:hypothetical protein
MDRPSNQERAIAAFLTILVLAVGFCIALYHTGYFSWLRPSVFPVMDRDLTPQEEMAAHPRTNIIVTERYGRAYGSSTVQLSIAPIPGVEEVESVGLSFGEWPFGQDLYSVPWLEKATTTVLPLQEYRDEVMNIRFLYPSSAGSKPLVDQGNGRFTISGTYRLDESEPHWPAFQATFSEAFSAPEIGGTDMRVSPTYFCSFRLAPSIPLASIHGCYSSGTTTSVIQGWDNDAGYEVLEADVELDHPRYKSANIRLQYRDLETDRDPQTLLRIIDSIHRIK